MAWSAPPLFEELLFVTCWEDQGSVVFRLGVLGFIEIVKGWGANKFCDRKFCRVLPGVERKFFFCESFFA